MKVKIPAHLAASWDFVVSVRLKQPLAATRTTMGKYRPWVLPWGRLAGLFLLGGVNVISCVPLQAAPWLTSPGGGT